MRGGQGGGGHRQTVRAEQSQFHCMMSRSHRSGPVWTTPRNSGLCTATAHPAMTSRSTARTGEMLPCPGNNLRRHCSRTHRHASPHHRVTPFEWSLSLDMSQRRDNQMTDDRPVSDLARHVYQASIASPRLSAGPSWETGAFVVAGQQADKCGVNYSSHKPTARRAEEGTHTRPAVSETGLTSMPRPSTLPNYEPGIWKLPRAVWPRLKPPHALIGG